MGTYIYFDDFFVMPTKLYGGSGEIIDDYVIFSGLVFNNFFKRCQRIKIQAGCEDDPDMLCWMHLQQGSIALTDDMCCVILIDIPKYVNASIYYLQSLNYNVYDESITFWMVIVLLKMLSYTKNFSGMLEIKKNGG